MTNPWVERAICREKGIESAIEGMARALHSLETAKYKGARSAFEDDKYCCDDQDYDEFLPIKDTRPIINIQNAFFFEVIGDKKTSSDDSDSSGSADEDSVKESVLGFRSDGPCDLKFTLTLPE